MNKYSNRLFLLFLAIATGLLVYTRFNYIHIPFERDEGEYAYAGSLLLHGHLPYREAYNMKFPGSYFMYALIMKVGGETIEAIRIGVCIIVLLTALVAGAIARLLTKNKIAAAVAATTFLALDNTMGYNGLMANSEHFVNLFAAGGIFLMLLYLEHPKQLALLFISGFLLSCAVIMKQYGYPFCLFGLLLITTEIWKKPLSEKIKALGLFSIGGLLPVVCLLFWLLQNDLWQKFRFLTIDYAYAYVGLGNASLAHHNIYLEIAILVILLLLARQKNARIVLGWLIFSIIAFSTGRYFRPHYYILAFPALAVLAGYAFYFLGKILSFELSKTAVYTSFILFFATHKEEQFTSTPLSNFNKQYSGEVFADMPVIASRINGLIPPGDKLSLFSEEPELLFYSRRIAASGYIYSYPLFENQPYAQQMVNEFISEVEANPSRLFVYNNTWRITNQSSYNYFDNWWNRYRQGFYLKEVYYANSPSDGQFKNEEEIKSDSSYKNAGIRIEFWMKK